MKKLLIKSGLPMLALTLAVGGALAFTNSEGAISKNYDETIVLGKLFESCVPTQVECTTDQTGMVCSNGSSNLYREDGNGQCTIPLFRIMPEN